MLTVKRNSTTVECVELAELKTFLRVDFIQFDSILNTCITSAREWVEQYTSTFWAKGTATIHIAGMTGTDHNTYWAGIESVIDDDGTEASLEQAEADYTYLYFEADPATEYDITVNIGTETPPATVRMAVMMIAGMMYSNTSGEVPNYSAIKTMLFPYRKFLFI
jgi:hypothetical protein